MDRGTSKLNDLISRIKNSNYDPSMSFEEAFTGAKPVDPNRVSLPDKAAIIDPKDHLTGERLQDFITMPQWVPTSLGTSFDPKPCHKVDSQHWPLLLKKLKESDMISFVPWDEVLKENGKPVKGGLFCVPHKVSSDRLINDRRPLNAREHRLNWCSLPSGPMLCQLLLEPSESVRGSGDDLSNYFYLIKHLKGWLRRNCFGDPITGALCTELGLDPSQKYLAAFKVVCMGDTNGVDIAQATHEAILQAANCMNEHNMLVYGRTFPASRTLEGLYIDDHIVIQVVNKKATRQRGKEADELLMQQSRNKYQELGLPRSEKKAFDKTYDFKAWGTCVCSQTGRVGSPYEKLRQIEVLATELVNEGLASKKALQKLVGLFIHPFMHRRECMGLFHHIYAFIEQMPEKGLKKLPPYVKDEILSAILVLPLAEASARWPVSVQISASDASSEGGGRASTITSKAFAKTLYRFSEMNGEYTRLDWDMHGIQPPSSMSVAPQPLLDTLQKHHWISTQSIKFGKREHINILELEMIKQEIKCRANSGRGGCRIVNLCDSRVALGCFAKGRSSSRNLNHKLRSCVPWLLAGDIHLSNIWVPTDMNPADHPSRGKEIPPPVVSSEDPLLDREVLEAVQIRRPMHVQNMLEQDSQRTGSDPIKYIETNPGFLTNNFVDPQHQKRSQQLPGGPPRKSSPCKTTNDSAAEACGDQASLRCRFREFCSGKGRLSDRMRLNSQLDVSSALEFKNKGRGLVPPVLFNAAAFKKLCRDAAAPGQLWHFGFAFSSFSVLMHANKGTRRWNRPEGDGSLETERLDNEVLCRICKLIDILQKHNSYWTLDSPSSSYLWGMQQLLKKFNFHSGCHAEFDQCSYGLRIKDGNGSMLPCQKPTIIIGNLPGLSSLSKQCQCQDSHVRAVGGVRTPAGWKCRSELAGHFPIKLCDAYAHLATKVLCSDIRMQWHEETALVF